MKNRVSVILLLLAVIAAVGVYRGWFIVNKPKIEQDEQMVKEELQGLGQKVKTKSGELTGTSYEAGSSKKSD